MTLASNEYIDQTILLFASREWRKVAMVVSQVFFDCEDKGLVTSDRYVADRIAALVGEGKLQSQGDLSRWRHSEVRLPSPAADGPLS